ncbi:acetyl-CoA acetyltransferase [Steroidobacter denitrificans]|uniref:Acetyl-CoA acetyltransferase n=1 Tax=Steroidobacter denitrificans TaxID=465721 RepID=A0A127FB85_STEDE|nr:thiolase family protein [Steroidobacter denitrificans]AMN47684.1 acetyl-CoA acetyltransferase [Steroidobacter denitrificans]
MSDVYIIGAGIHPFGRAEKSGLELGVHAARLALQDAEVEWKDMQFGYGGSHDAGNADAVIPRLGLTGAQFINVYTGCATGVSSLLSGYLAIKAGEFDLGLVVGFDKHPRGAFITRAADWGLPDWYGEAGFMLTTQYFGIKIRRYMDLYDISPSTLARVAEKAYINGSRADHAWRRSPVDLDTIGNSQMINDPLTKYMFCAPSDGGAAVVLASEKKARELGKRGVRVRAVTVRTRVRGSYEVYAPSIDIEPGPSATVLASQAAYELSGLGPEDVDLAQIQDTESGSEIMHMAENGFCEEGEQERMLLEGATRLEGRLPINTDGGCLACGEPIGASGLRQVYENYVQLMGRAGSRQVGKSPQIAYSQVYGAPGVGAVAILGG